MQAQPNSLCIDLFGRLQKPEELKQLALVFKLDADPIVNHLNFNETILSFVKTLANDSDPASFWSKLQGITLEVEQNLLKAILICVHDELWLLIVEPYEFSCQLDVHEVCFLLLDRHYLFKRILNIKIT